MQKAQSGSWERGPLDREVGALLCESVEVEGPVFIPLSLAFLDLKEPALF